MPIYEYKCTKCGEIFEAFQRITDLPLTECRFCGGKVEQMISHSNFQLKGSGWYLTDYAKKSQPSHTTVSDSTKTSEKSDTSTGKGNSPSAKTGKNSA